MAVKTALLFRSPEVRASEARLLSNRTAVLCSSLTFSAPLCSRETSLVFQPRKHSLQALVGRESVHSSKRGADI